MTVWQQKNPGKCARCSVHLSGYDPELPPVCDQCTRSASGSNMGAVDAVKDILARGEASDVAGAVAEIRKDLDRWVRWINSEHGLAGEYAYTRRDLEAQLRLLEWESDEDR